VQSAGPRNHGALPDGDLLVWAAQGSFIFLSDLVRKIDRPLQVDFIVASSYGEGTVSSGNVRLYMIRNGAGRQAYRSVEDIVDTARR